MTEFWHRAFVSAGCDPACHCCWDKISIGSKFKLSTIKKMPIIPNGHFWKEGLDNYDDKVENKEVMLCHKCTPGKFDKKQRSDLKKAVDSFESFPNKQNLGCFRVNGKIVH